MDLQYVLDNEGNQTAVIIPIEEWNTIISKHQDLKSLGKSKIVSPKKPSDYSGSISKDFANQMIGDIEFSRNQWKRDI